MKYFLWLPGLLMFLNTAGYGQTLSAFPEDTPRRWGGAGVSIPDVGITVQAYPRSIPLIIRPQIDFGIFQNHGHPVRGGKLSLLYATPFTTLGIGRAFIGGIVGYNVERITDDLIINERNLLREERIFSYGGVLGEMIEIHDNLFLSAEVRFLNQEIEHRAVNPQDAFGRQTTDRYRTAWMVGLQYYIW
jgi:hypothetical protein